MIDDLRTPGQNVHGDAALFVLPLGTRHQRGPVAAWATTSGWALGGEQVLGAAWVLSDDGVFSPRQAAAKVSGAPGRPIGDEHRWRHYLPEPPITLVKDVRKARHARQSSLGSGGGPWLAHRVSFVWQRHVLFRRDAMALSRQLGAPLVLSVHAMQVEEAASWGVQRPGWQRYAERWGELPQLLAADLVTCISPAVAKSVEARGVPASRILITPNGVDVDHFSPRSDRAALRRKLGLADRFVVGWSGSFRRFHGLDLALRAMSELQRTDPDIVLLLMGDGQQRADLERRGAESGLTNVTFTGSIPHDRMPSYLAACDVGLVLSPESGGFHYSPVKLREYMACGLPVVAPAVGEMRETLDHQTDAVLVAPREPAALADALRLLRRDTQLRRKLGSRGIALARERWTWSRQVERVLNALAAQAPPPKGHTCP